MAGQELQQAPAPTLQQRYVRTHVVLQWGLIAGRAFCFQGYQELLCVLVPETLFCCLLMSHKYLLCHWQAITENTASRQTPIPSAGVAAAAANATADLGNLERHSKRYGGTGLSSESEDDSEDGKRHLFL